MKSNEEAEDLQSITRMEGRADWSDHVLDAIADCVREMKKSRKLMAVAQRAFILGPNEEEDSKDGHMNLNSESLCAFIRQGAFLVKVTRKALEQRVKMEALDEGILNPSAEAAFGK